MAAVTKKKLAAEAWGSLLQVHAALVPHFDRRLRAECHLPLAWYDVLLELSVAPAHRLTMSELGARVVLSRSRVSRVVDELAGEDLVRRETNPDDARSAFAALTSKGLARFRAAAPVYLAEISEEFADGLSESELTTIAAALQRVRARVEAQ